jgi:hypothetical protein
VTHHKAVVFRIGKAFSSLLVVDAEQIGGTVRILSVDEASSAVESRSEIQQGGKAVEDGEATEKEECNSSECDQSGSESFPASI